MTDLIDNQDTEQQKQQKPKPDVTILQAAVVSLSGELKVLEKEVREVRNESKQIIIGVVIAFIFVLITVAVEVILFHSGENRETARVQDKVESLIEKNYESSYRIQQLEQKVPAKK